MRINLLWELNDLRNQRFCVIVVFTGEKIRQQNIAVENKGNFQARETPSFKQTLTSDFPSPTCFTILCRLLQTSLTTGNDVPQVS